MATAYPRPTPDDSDPVFFHGEFVYRSFYGVAGAVFLFVFSLAFLYPAWNGSPADNPISRFGDVLFAVVGLGAAGYGIRSVWGWIRNERVQIEVSSSGITRGNHYWPWSEIRSFAGTRYENGVSLSFELNRATSFLWHDGLDTIPLLTVEEYVALAEKLKDQIATRYPNVEIAAYPLPPDDFDG